MGCHTWFHKKIDKSVEDSIKEFLKVIDEGIIFSNKLINDRDSIDKDLLESYPKWDIDFGKKELKFYTDLLDRYNNGKLSIESILEGEYLYYGSNDTYCSRNKSFYVDAGYHDIFRKYGYPDDVLLSYMETIEYIMDSKNECIMYENTFEQIENFWIEYPDGMINFG